MKLRHATLIALPMLGVVLYWTYLQLQPSEDADRSVRVLPVSPSQSPVMIERGTAASVDDITALREEVASLRAEITLLQRHAPAQSASAPARADSQAAADIRSDPLARADAAREDETRMQAVDAAFRNQAIDPTWSANTAAAIRNALSSEEVGGIQADNIDCRSESCRVELRDDGSGSLSKAMPMLAQQLGGALPTITANSIAQPNGGSTVVLYLSAQAGQQPSR